MGETAGRDSNKRGVAAAAGLGAMAGWGHVVYPTWMALRSARARDPAPPSVPTWPPISVVIPGYREAAVIGAKLANVMRNGYGGEIEVIVVAEDAATAAAARSTAAATVVENEMRIGKAASINRGVEAAHHDWVVLTDADTTLLAGALGKLVRWLADPNVGAVAGEKVVTGSHGEALYWRFEGWLKSMEWRTGSTIGMSGGLVAVRRSVWQPLPEKVIADDFWIALDTNEAGLRVAYEPGALWSDESDEENPPLATDWERRTRVVVGTLDLAVRRWRLLLPGSPVAGQLWGHRVARSSIGPIAHALLVMWSIGAAPKSRVACAVVAAHIAAAHALARKWRGGDLGPLEKLIAHVVYLQLVALGGVGRYLRGDTAILYPKEERTAPTDGP